MHDEHLREELEIMDQSERPPRQLDADVFDQPLKELCRWTLRSIASSASVGDAVRLMQQHRIGAVLVVDGEALKGIFTERDVLLKVAGKHADLDALPVARFMTADPDHLTRDDAIKFLCHKMHVGGYRHVPIVDADGRPTHLISLRDVLGFILEHFPQEVVNVAPGPSRVSSPPDAPGS